MRCTDVFVHYVKNPNFMLKMTDPIRLIFSPYQTLVQNQILYFLKIFIIFWVGRKSSLDSKNSKKVSKIYII
jgi:hypothetical protein